MPDWTKSMTQTFEYYEVDPGTWENKRQLTQITASTITRDSTTETLESATIDSTESLGECYVRIYLVTIQNGITEKFPLGTFLVQTPRTSFDGKVTSISMDAYSPLLELKEKCPAIGYSMAKGTNVLEYAYRLTRENLRAPVVEPDKGETLETDFVANTDDTWLSYLTDLIATEEYVYNLDEMSRVLFAPKQDAASLQSVWTYTDDNSSILYSDIDMDRDLYGIPNVAEVVYSQNGYYFYGRAVNDDPNSPLSTVNRGREVTKRISTPSIVGIPTQHQIQEYAEQQLRDLSTLEYTITYKHGYCPVRVGYGVRLNYERAGITDVKAKVISQTISCKPGCQVTEKAVFTTKLWR